MRGNRPAVEKMERLYIQGHLFGRTVEEVCREFRVGYTVARDFMDSLPSRINFELLRRAGWM